MDIVDIVDILSKVSATRILDVLDEHGQLVGTVAVSLGCPMQEPSAGQWSCPHRIGGLGYERPYWGPVGSDGLKAMAGAIFILGANLQGTEEAQAGRLRWAGSSLFRSAFLRVHLIPEDGVTTEFGKVLAETTTEDIKDISSRHGPVTISLGHPRQAPSGVWFCPYRIAGLGVDCIWWASGFDSMHALQSALFLIDGFDDYVTEVFKRHERWAGSDVLGFPTVPDRAKG